jgi:hypothetical protein
MRAPIAPSTPQVRLHADAAAVEVQALYRGVVIGSRCLVADDVAAFLIGSAKGVDAPAAAYLLSGETHRLVSADARGFSVELTEQMTGTVIFEDHSAPLSDLLRAHGPLFTAPPAARLQIACGDVAFLVTATSAPPIVPRPALARLKDHWPALVAAAGALAVLLFLALLPPDPKSISGDVIDSRRVWLDTVNIPPVPPPAPTGASAPAGGGASGGGPRVATPARRPAPARRVARSRPAGPEDVRRRGVLGVLLAYQGDSLGALFSTDSALDPTAIADLTGSGGPGGGGPGIGLGTTGTGAGPGGPLVGPGPGDIIGKCDAACQKRVGAGTGIKAGLPPRIPRQLQAIPGPTIERGSLDKEIVRRVIRRHLNEVKYCYEQQLPRHPELAGRISVQFSIAPTGSVMTSLIQSSTVGNVAVESCVVQAVRRWEFPKPPGGGLVIVSYPFVLVPAGAP